MSDSPLHEQRVALSLPNGSSCRCLQSTNTSPHIAERRRNSNTGGVDHVAADGVGEQVMLIDDGQLAVLLRTAQWEIDALAFDLPAGRCTSERREQLADALVKLAEVLRPSMVIDRPTSASSVPSDTRGT